MKGLAAREITLLILAMLVLAIVAFLVYNQFFGGHERIRAINCNTAVFDVCNRCKTCRISTAGVWDDNDADEKCTALCNYPKDSSGNKCPGDTSPYDQVGLTECQAVGVT